MQRLMIRVQDRAKEIKNLQDNVLPKLNEQLKDAAGIFKGKERKTITAQIQQMKKTPSASDHACETVFYIGSTVPTQGTSGHAKAG